MILITRRDHAPKMKRRGNNSGKAEIGIKIIERGSVSSDGVRPGCHLSLFNFQVISDDVEGKYYWMHPK